MQNINNKKELEISRAFDAPLDKVWEAWTVPEEIMKWWGPEDFTCPVCEVDLRVGGKYLFCMRGEAILGHGVQDFWSGGDYIEIIPFEKIICTDYFSNEKGDIVDPVAYGMSSDFPKESTVTITFKKEMDKTKLSIVYADLTEEAFKAMIESQMKEGWKSSLDKLAYSLSKSKN